MILAIDQGTTGTTCLIVDERLRVRGRGYRELRQRFPRPGWVEQDPEELQAGVLAAAEAALADAGLRPEALAAVGVANQRETTVLWERSSGRPVAPAIVWQDRRTAARCRELPSELIRTRTGLVPDPYFSATKLEWLLARAGRPAEELAFGTVDAWLASRLAGRHVTDRTNASRTLLYGLAAEAWDDELLALFGVPRTVLPRVVGSAEVVGDAALLGARLPLAALAGDQQAALAGHGCFAPGEAKATYGTGSFVLAHAGAALEPPPPGLLATAAAPAGYALEGAVLTSGAAVQWLRDGLGLVGSAAETEALARSVDSSDGVVFVPALTGLGSPHWEPDARGLLAGVTRGTTRAHVVRATLEAIAFQIADVVDALPLGLHALRADGGASANGFLMQFQADLLGLPVEVAREQETTALGAAALAGLALGLWSPPDVRGLLGTGTVYEPTLSRDEAETLREGWRLAMRRVLVR
ncbi:MAG: FGGY family carbohydrate kinase [Pseudomonadota bacterium]